MLDLWVRCLVDLMVTSCFTVENSFSPFFLSTMPARRTPVSAMTSSGLNLNRAEFPPVAEMTEKELSDMVTADRSLQQELEEQMKAMAGKGRSKEARLFEHQLASLRKMLLHGQGASGSGSCSLNG